MTLEFHSFLLLHGPDHVVRPSGAWVTAQFSAMFAVTVEPSVKITDPFFQVVSVQRHHPVSHHFLFPNQSLKFVSFETFQPAGGDDKVLGVSFKVSCRKKGR